MTFINSKNLSDKITDYISNKIIKLEYKPGDRIVESKIAKDLNVSHSPVREALRVLEKNRLVTLIPRKGAYVTELNEPMVVSLFEIFNELMVLVGKKCVKNAGKNDLQRINVMVKDAVVFAKTNNSEAYYNAIIEFGLSCIAGSCDSFLEQIIFELFPSLRRILYISFSYRKNDLSENAAILSNGLTYINEKNSEMVEITLREWLEYEMKNSIQGLKTGGFIKD